MVLEALKIVYPEQYGMLEEVFSDRGYFVREYRLHDPIDRDRFKEIIVRVKIPYFSLKIYNMVKNGELPIVFPSIATPSDPIIRGIARGLLLVTRRSGNYSLWRESQLALEIAQSLIYSEEYGSPDYPIIVLYNNHGDCDVKVYLALSILQAMNVSSGILSIENKELNTSHALLLVNVQLPPWINGSRYNYSMVNNTRYYIAETAISNNLVVSRDC